VFFLGFFFCDDSALPVADGIDYGYIAAEYHQAGAE
jgi:hypothetical protein